MTFKEKWEKENPNIKFNPFSLMCPFYYGYEDNPKNEACLHRGYTCPQCWDREIPEEEISELTIQELNNPNPEIVQAAKSMVNYVGGRYPEIKDSGDRTQFETGAVRDMREGKGRCDLMPLEVVSTLLGQDSDRSEAITWNLNWFKKTNNTDFLYDAVRLFGDACWHDKFSMLLEVAKHFEEGAKKYGENNWQKGIPVHCYIDSAIRHYLKWLRGDKDEPHDRAFVWNIMCCIWEVDYHKED